MWSEAGLERLRGAVRARLRVVLESDCPPLESKVRIVLEQRLDSAVQDVMELVRRGENTVPVENLKKEQHQIKQEPESPESNIVCVKVVEEEQEINFKVEPPSIRTTQDFNHHSYQAEAFLYCHLCSSTPAAQVACSPLSLPSLCGQSQCSFCGHSSSPELLLLDHDYTQDLLSVGKELEQGAYGFRCSVCGQDFSKVGMLLEHMSQHLSLSGVNGPGVDSEDGEDWSFEDDVYDEALQETICSVCGVVFSDFEALQEHLRTHL